MQTEKEEDGGESESAVPSLTILLHTCIVFKKTLKIETLRLRGRLALSTVAVTKPCYRGFSSTERNYQVVLIDCLARSLMFGF